jgi:hypothetical protein
MFIYRDDALIVTVIFFADLGVKLLLLLPTTPPNASTAQLYLISFEMRMSTSY